jgi:putative ABC transport system substrate-binding protein
LGWTADTLPLPSLPLEALREGLRNLGWREGENLVLEVRSGDREKGAALAAELLRAGVEVMAVQGPMVFSARGLSRSVPIVFNINGDPLQAGLVTSLARPGGLLTGVTALSTELATKRLELLKQAAPGIRRVALLANGGHPGVNLELDASRAAASRLGLETTYLPVSSAAGFPAAFEEIERGRFSGIVAFPDALVNRHASAIAGLARRLKIPSISGWAEFALAGNLLSYGPQQRDFFRLVAACVDKLLRGVPASDIPVQQPTTFELVINQRVAGGLGLKLSQPLLALADRVVE